MDVTGYRGILRLPGVARLIGFGLIARIPHAGFGAVVTLFVVLGLHRAYAEAGLAVAAATLGGAVGGPWRGRLIDRIGLRRALVPSVVAELVSWGAMPFIGYRGVILAAFAGGLLGIPMFSVIRMCLAAMVPADRRRAAYSLDAMAVEISFMVGPAAGVLLVTRWNPDAAVLTIGALFALSGIALIMMDPPTRDPLAPGAGAGAAAPRPVAGRPRRSWRPAWFSARLAVALVVAFGALVVLTGTDVATIAALRRDGQLGVAWLVYLAWCAASMIGALVYGSVRRTPSGPVLLLTLGAFTAPIGLVAHGPVTLAAALLVAGLACAPVVSATSVAVTQLVPDRARGEAMGWYATAVTLGTTLGAPLAGAAVDLAGPWAGFAAVGGIGVLAGVPAVLLERVLRPAAVGNVPDAPDADLFGEPAGEELGVGGAQGVPAVKLSN